MTRTGAGNVMTRERDHHNRGNVHPMDREQRIAQSAKTRPGKHPDEHPELKWPGGPLLTRRRPRFLLDLDEPAGRAVLAVFLSLVLIGLAARQWGWW